jgi:hypothetical protein
VDQNEGSGLTSPVVRDTTAPKIGVMASFDLAPHSQKDVTVKVYHQDVNRPLFIGTASVSISDVRGARHVEGWFPVIGNDMMSHGEVAMKVICRRKLELSRFEPPSEWPPRVALCAVRRPRVRSLAHQRRPPQPALARRWPSSCTSASRGGQL